MSAGKSVLDPEVAVVCGTSQFADDQHDVLLNPAVLFELREYRFPEYQALESLQEYVFIWEEECLFGYYRRQGNQWLYTMADGLDATLSLPAIHCEIPLREIYFRVESTNGGPP